MSEALSADAPGLVADLGGTHLRLAISDGRERHEEKILRNDRYASLESALLAYLRDAGAEGSVRHAAIAVACPVVGDEVELTNLDWGFSIEDLRSVLALESLRVVNDFEALAHALPFLGPDQRETLWDGHAVVGQPMALLGPGTGLGTAGLVPCAGHWKAVAGEGGHRDLAVRTDREWEIQQRLAKRFGHVSAERALSGPGLVNLYQAIRGSRKKPSPEVVVERAAAGGDEAAAETLRLFSLWLGAVAGDLALTFGARGGVFVGGGIIPKMGSTFDRTAFAARFVDKGRFEPYLEPIPVDLITDPLASLSGLAEVLRRDVSGESSS